MDKNLRMVKYQRMDKNLRMVKYQRMDKNLRMVKYQRMDKNLRMVKYREVKYPHPPIMQHNLSRLDQEPILLEEEC